MEENVALMKNKLLIMDENSDEAGPSEGPAWAGARA
jgi:hypothetical protein